MKMLWCALVLSFAAAVGCVTLPARWSEPEVMPSAEDAAAPAPEPSGPVSADQVTEENARAMAEALRKEIERAAQEVKPAPETVPLGMDTKP
jgi:hypothetical protein